MDGRGLIEVARDRERSAARRDERTEYVLPGADLARAIRGAVIAETQGRKVAGRKVSREERDALAGMVAEALARHNVAAPPERGTAREVLAWIARAERMPTIAERETMARGHKSRDYLRTVARGLLRDSRQWRDAVADWRDHRAGADETRAAEMVSLDTARERADEGESLLAVAQEREALAAGETVPPLPLADAWEVAQRAALIGEARAAERAEQTSRDGAPMAAAMAAAMAARFPLTERERRAMAAALVVGLPDPSDEERGGVQLAGHIGVTYGTARNLVSAGGKLWRDLCPEPRDLAGIVREAAAQVAALDREGALRRRAARVVAAPWQASLPADAYLGDEERAASQAVAAVARDALVRAESRSSGGPGDSAPHSYRTTQVIRKRRGATLGRRGKRHGGTVKRLVRPLVVTYTGTDTRTYQATAIGAVTWHEPPCKRHEGAGRTFTAPSRVAPDEGAERAVWQASRHWPDTLVAGQASYSPDRVRAAQRLSSTSGKRLVPTAAQREAALAKR